MSKHWALLFLLACPAVVAADDLRMPWHAVRSGIAPAWRNALKDGDANRAATAILRLALSPDVRLYASPTDPELLIPEFQVALATLEQAPESVQSSVRDRLEVLARTAWQALEDRRDPAQLQRFVHRFGSTKIGNEALARLGDVLKQQGRGWEAAMAWQEAERHAIEPEQKAALHAKLITSNVRLRQLGLMAWRGTEDRDPLHAMLDDPLSQLVPLEEYALPPSTRQVLAFPAAVVTSNGKKIEARWRPTGKTDTLREGREPDQVELFQGGGRLFTVSRGSLGCFDLSATRGFGWHLTAPKGALWQSFVAAQPIVLDERCYVAVRAARENVGVLSVACLDLRSGRLLWHEPVCEARVDGTEGLQLLSAGHAIVAITSGLAVGFDGMRGEPLWARTWKTDADNGPVDALTSQGVLSLCHARTGRIDLVHAITGELKLTRYAVAPTHLVAMTPEKVILANGSEMMAWGVEDGSQQWRASGKSHDVKQPAVVLSADALWWATTDGLLALDVATGLPLIEPVWLRHVPSGRVSWHDGMLWLRTGETLYGFGRPRREGEARLGTR